MQLMYVDKIHKVFKLCNDCLFMNNEILLDSSRMIDNAEFSRAVEIAKSHYQPKY